MSMKSINPWTGETVREYPEMSGRELESAIGAARDAQRDWGVTGFPARRAALRGMAALLRERTRGYAELIVREMGKPITQALAEVEKCAWVCEYYEAHGEEFLAPEVVSTDAGRSHIECLPLGVVLAVMPWNFPFWQMFRFLAPALMAGNGSLLKHASNVTGCSLAIEALVREAGFPGDLVRSLLIPSGRVSQVIDHTAVRAVTLTGSVAAGRAVAERAGRALKKSVLELGGSDPYLVLADADLELAVATCASARLLNTGQSCIAAKRFIVDTRVYDEFRERIVTEMRSYVAGDPMDPSTQLGPLARADLRDELHGQVEASIAAGARVLLGGKIPSGPGAMYPATVLENVAPGMPAWEEELFGPVASLIRAADEADAVRIANDTSFGLGAAVFSRDTERATRIATRDIEAGACFVNGGVKSDPRLPFGGVKDSGYGRELSRHGILEFVNLKSIWVR